MAESSAEAGKRMPSDNATDTGTVRSVERAVRILQTLFLAAPGGMRVSELSRELDLHKTTVVRLLRTLQRLNLVRRDERSECYAWEPLAWVTMLSKVRSLLSPVEAVQSILEDLAESAGETALVGYPDASGRNMGVAGRALPEKAIRVDPGLYRMPPMHCTAAGKAYLTGMSDVELARWAEGGLTALTEHTITSPTKLLADIAKARERGYAVTREESILRTAGVGVPVRDDTGKTVGGLQLCVPIESATQKNIERWAAFLSDSTRKLTQVIYAAGPGEVYRREEVTPGVPLRAEGGEVRRGHSPKAPRRPFRIV